MTELIKQKLWEFLQLSIDSDAAEWFKLRGERGCHDA